MRLDEKCYCIIKHNVEKKNRHLAVLIFYCYSAFGSSVGVSTSALTGSAEASTFSFLAFGAFLETRGMSLSAGIPALSRAYEDVGFLM